MWLSGKQQVSQRRSPLCPHTNWGQRTLLLLVQEMSKSWDPAQLKAEMFDVCLEGLVSFSVSRPNIPACIQGQNFCQLLSGHFDRLNSGPRFWSPGFVSRVCGLIYKISYDNASVTINLRWTSNWQNIPWRTQDSSQLWFTWKIVASSEILFVN